MVVLAAVSIIVLEFTNVARNFYETSNQKQIADQSPAMQLALQQEKTALAIKAAEDAKRAAFDAQNAEAIARESTLRQEAERREKQALADKAGAERRTAEAVAREATLRQEAERREKQALADNAPQQQKGLAEKAEGEGESAKAIAHYAEEKARADALLAKAKAAEEVVMARAYTGNPHFGEEAQSGQDAASHKEGEFLVYQGVSFSLGRRSAERAANDNACRQSCLNKTNFTCVGGTFFRKSGSCSLYEKMNVQSVARDPDAVGFVRTNTEVIEVVGAVVQPKAGVAPASAHNASSASGDVGGRLFNQNWAAANRLAGGTGDPAHDGIFAKAEPQAAAPPPAPAAAQPATMQSARTPPAFDCRNATLGVDHVICSSPQLVEAEARLEDAYRAARAVRGDDMKTEQRAWAKTYGPSCGLPAKGRPSPALISASQNCVAQAIRQRIHDLETVTAQRQAE